MKTQVARNWRLGRTELQVTTQRGESLDIAGANWLAASTSDLLLHVDYDPEKAHSSKLQLAYDITGLTALKRRLPKVWDQESYYAVLEGIERVAIECSSGKRLIERVLFDVDHVYLTESCEPRFVYVPLDGVAYNATENNPLLVLAALASRRLRFDSMAGSRHGEHLRKFVLDKEVFSPNALRRFLDDEFPEIRKASTSSQTLWSAEEVGPSDGQLAFMDSLFQGFSGMASEDAAAGTEATGEEEGR